MAAFKAFDPDPDLTDPEDDYFGTGTWTYDDGTSAYGQGDRDEAMRLWQRPDTRLAQSAADTTPMGPPPPPGNEALNANEPQSDVGPPPMLARPPEPETAAQEGAGSGIRIPKESRIAWVHNNPGNLKYVGQEGATQGEPAEDGGHWAAFETPEDGLAALNRQVEIDAGRGQTVRELISKYAPPGSNDTEQYIRQASQELGASPDAKLGDLDRNRVVAFMARKESSTELGGTSLPEAPPARAPMPGGGLPSSMNGMPAAAAEVRGMPLSPDQIAARQQGVYDQTMTQVAGVQQAAQARQQGRDEALKLVADAHQRSQQSQQEQLARATAARAEAEQNVQKAMATKLDHGRVIKDMSTGQLVMGAIATALGTLGNAMAIRRGMKTVSVTDWIEKAIADDIEQQKEDKRSRVAHWTRMFGDAEMGVKAARAEMYEAAGQYAVYQAQHKAANADIQGQMMQDSANLIAKGQAETQGLIDKENERVSIRYQTPDPKGAVDAVESFQKKLAARKAYEESGATPEQLAGYDAAMGISSPAGESVIQRKVREDKEKLAREEQALTEGEGKAEAAHQTVTQLGTTAGLTRDPNTGRWTMPEGMGLGWKMGKMTELKAAREAAVDGLARLQTGATISSNEESRFSKILGDENASLEEIMINLNALDALIQSRRKQSRVGTPGAPSAWR